jgi:hypothetical protein
MNAEVLEAVTAIWASGSSAPITCATRLRPLTYRQTAHHRPSHQSPRAYVLVSNEGEGK